MEVGADSVDAIANASVDASAIVPQADVETGIGKEDTAASEPMDIDRKSVV